MPPMKPSNTRTRRPLSSRALAAAGAALLSLGPIAHGQADWEVVRLPAAMGGAPGLPALLDGRHLLPPSAERTAPADLGEALPLGVAEEIVIEAVRDVGGAEVVPLDGAVLVRGASAARAAARGALAAARRQLDGLRFDVGVRLTLEGADAPRISERRTLRGGGSASFGARQRGAFVHGYAVEVATDVATATPTVGVTMTGETVHLWASTSMDVDGTRQLHVQGLLDVSRLQSITTFDTFVPALGELEHPVVDAVQVLFAGVVPAEGPLRVRVSDPAVEGALLLEIDARPLSAGARGDQVIDLSRGLWRERLRAPHALSDEAGPEPRVALTPAGLIQLHARQFADRKAALPRTTDSAILAAPARPEEGPLLRRLRTAIEPASSTRQVTLRRADGLEVTLPAVEGALLRVARTRETTIVRRYSPQVAQEAAICEPDIEHVVSGFLVEAVLEDGVLQGQGRSNEVSIDRIHTALSSDSGRVQLPVRSDRSFPLWVEAGAPSSPLSGVSITLSPAPDSPPGPGR